MNMLQQIWLVLQEIDETLTWGPFYWHGLTLIPVWISNYTHYKMWDETTYPFLNFNGCTLEVSEWINNLIPHFTGACDYLSMLELELNHVSWIGLWVLFQESPAKGTTFDYVTLKAVTLRKSVLSCCWQDEHHILTIISLVQNQIW